MSVTLAAELVGADWAALAMRVDESLVRPVVWSRPPRSRLTRDPQSARLPSPEPHSFAIRPSRQFFLVLEQGTVTEAPASEWFADVEDDYGWVDARGRLDRPIICGVPVTALGSIRAALLLYLPYSLPTALRRVAAACADQLGDLIENEERYMRERRLVSELHLSRRMLVQAEERIRREVAEEIHGTVQNALLSAAYRVDRVAAALKGAPDLADQSRELSAVYDDLRNTQMNRLRRLSHRLHPFDLAGGIVPALKALLGSWHTAGDVDLEVDAVTRVAVAPGQLCPACALAIYRFGEEGVTNAFKHARPRRVRIALSIDPEAADALLVQVADDGRGFDPSVAQSGLGLSTMRARMEEAGARWRVDSTPGRGTTLEARFPLPCAHSAAGRRTATVVSEAAAAEDDTLAALGLPGPLVL